MADFAAPSTPFYRHANGLKHHLLGYGNPAADSVAILLHGFLDNAHSWDFFARAFLRYRPDFYLLALDFRGHGRSQWAPPGAYYHFFDYIADLDSLLQPYLEKKCHLIAHSMGGNVATYWAGARPGHLQTLTLLESAIVPNSDPEDGPERMGQWLDQMAVLSQKSPKIMGSLEEVGRRLRGTMPRLSDEGALYLAQFASEAVEKGFRWRFDPKHRTRGPTGYRLEIATPFWRRIQAPTLMLEGGESIFLPADIEDRYAHFRRHKRVKIAGASHGLHVENAPAIAQAIHEFMGEQR